MDRLLCTQMLVLVQCSSGRASAEPESLSVNSAGCKTESRHQSVPSSKILSPRVTSGDFKWSDVEVFCLAASLSLICGW